MEVICSAQNGVVKRIAKLKQKKYRDELSMFFTEGYRNVSDTCAARPKDVVAVVFDERAYAARGGEFADFDTYVVDNAVFAKLTDTESSQGVLCINRLPESKPPTDGAIVLLDRVRDPGNVGTILRSCCAFGYGAVLCGCADVYSPKVVRSAMSAVLKCNISTDVTAADVKAAGYELICADMDGESVISAQKPRGKYCIVIGNEADGVDDGIKKLCDRTVSVPQRNIESLNAGVAAGILMFALNN